MMKNMGELLRKNKITLTGLLVLGLSLAGGECFFSTPARAQDWEPSIRAFEEQDKLNPPKPGGMVFTGSSSIRFWDTLADDMKPLSVINRGFGGSQYSDVNYFAKRIVIAYKPSAVVVYAGDNDLAEGSPKTPESVANDVREFVRLVRADLPESWIYVLSIKPSKLRWRQWQSMKEANQLIQEFIRTQQRVQFLDVATPMFDAQGALPDDLFRPDGLHPTRKCYALWTSIIKPVLLKQAGGKAATSQNLERKPGLIRDAGPVFLAALRQ